ncbi:hypothetical protein [Bifidobacterium breve]
MISSTAFLRLRTNR